MCYVRWFFCGICAALQYVTEIYSLHTQIKILKAKYSLSTRQNLSLEETKYFIVLCRVVLYHTIPRSECRLQLKGLVLVLLEHDGTFTQKELKKKKTVLKSFLAWIILL